ncbi:MAG: ParB/Srx family N-terminal domain-containing protein [Nodosilinea sp.]
MASAVINTSVEVSPRQDWKLSRLTPYENNTLVHKPEDVASLAAKIQEFGFVDPITVDEDGVILWGHKRRLAAIQLKLNTVPVVVVSGLTPSQKQALRIAHNKEGRKSDWDADALLKELKDLETQAIDLSATGFSVVEIESLFRDLKTLEASTFGQSSEPGNQDSPQPSTAELTFDDDPEAYPEDDQEGQSYTQTTAGESDVDEPPTSSVRVLQLFFDDNTIEEAMELIDALHPRFGTTTPTACVLAALRCLNSLGA